MTTTTTESQLRYLLDRLEIQDLQARYGLGQDLHQDGDNNVLREWNDVFAPNATLDFSAAGAEPSLTAEQVAEMMRGPGLGGGGSMGGLTRWQHIEGVAVVEIDGDTATARTPHLHTHTSETDGHGWNLMEAGFFDDRLERRPEGWRIVHRRLEILWLDVFATIENPLLASQPAG